MQKNSSKKQTSQVNPVKKSYLKNVRNMSINELIDELILMKPNFKKRSSKERATLKTHVERWIKDFL